MIGKCYITQTLIYYRIEKSHGKINRDRRSSQTGPGRERATRREANTLVRRSAQVILTQVDRAAQSEANTLARRSARARLGQVERVTWV